MLEEVRTKKKNLTTAWVDYKKAFDSVPHDWIAKCLTICKISPVLVDFLEQNMKRWNTTLVLNYTEGQLKSRTLSINSSIFQGDSLSPLLFCMALAPLSSRLKHTRYGYTTQSSMKINHIFYTDDFKMYAKNNKEQIGLLHTVKTFSDDIKMEFGFDKCAKASFVRGKLTAKEYIQIDIDTTIKQLEPEESYKYLRINEGDGIQHSYMKEKIRK